MRGARRKLFHLIEALDAEFAHVGTANTKESAGPSEQPLHRVIALESSPKRISQTLQIAKRLGHSPNVIEADATQLDWWDGAPFDHILLDAPCSGTGTLRRHPDIRILLEEQDIAEQVELQSALLSNLWQTLAPGGYAAVLHMLHPTRRKRRRSRGLLNRTCRRGAFSDPATCERTGNQSWVATPANQPTY